MQVQLKSQVLIQSSLHLEALLLAFLACSSDHFLIVCDLEDGLKHLLASARKSKVLASPVLEA